MGHRSGTTRTSPFASNVYTPPTGAPGYAGQRYDWDKGFSTDLRLEMEWETEQDEEEEEEETGERGRQGQEMMDVRRNGGGSRNRKEHGRGHGGGRKESTERHLHVVGVGEFMEKKSGHVQLEGRKAITTAVLDVGLADMVREFHFAPQHTETHSSYFSRSVPIFQPSPVFRGNGYSCTPSTNTASL